MSTPLFPVDVTKVPSVNLHGMWQSGQSYPELGEDARLNLDLRFA